MFHFYDDPRALFVCDEDDDLAETFIQNDFTSSLGFSEEELSRMAMDAPPVDSWKDPTDTEVFVGVDIARKCTLEQASAEFDFIRKRLTESNVISDPSHFTEEELVLRLFGPDSEVYNTLSKHIPYLKDDYKLFARCLGTYFWCCAVDQTLQELYDDEDFNKTELLATLEEYLLFWQAVATACLPQDRGDSTTNYHRGYVPLWRHLERSVNEMLRELFICNYEGKMTIVIDDDKMHFATSNPVGGPKLSQHVRDNRRGFVCHQMLFAALMVLVGMRYDGHGDTTQSSTMTLIKDQLGPSEGTTIDNVLTDIAFLLDQGYMGYPMLCEICNLGGHIESATS